MRSLAFSIGLVVSVLAGGAPLRAEDAQGPLVHEAIVDAPVAEVWEVFATAEGWRKLGVAKDGTVSFHYEVVLDHDPGSWGPGPDEAPYRFEGGAHWTGRALFLTAPRSQVEVTFAAGEGEGEKVATSFEPVAGRPGAYSVPDETRLRNAFFMVGKFDYADLSVGDASVTDVGTFTSS